MTDSCKIRAIQGFSNEARKLSSNAEHQTESTLLVKLVQASQVRLFHTPEQVAYAELNLNGLRKSVRVRSKAFQDWLARRYYYEYQKAPRAQALQVALGVVEGMALFEGGEYPIYVRLAESEGRVYLDLGRPDGAVVEVSPNSWQVIVESPVRFRRPHNMLPLPLPERGGRVDALQSVLNLAPEDWPLVAAWLVAALNPNGPYPLLFVQGEQGTGKSSLAWMLKDLVDPSTGSLRAHPREVRDLMLAAANSWVLSFDNLSSLPVWLSDGLCRLSTGGSFATRTLYHDDEESVLNAARPVILTGIEELATRGDLLDRAVLLYLPPIEATKQRPYRQICAQYEELRPYVLGALLDAVSQALQRLPHLKLEQLPRMADFTTWVVAASPGLGLDPETFLKAYHNNREITHELVLEGLPIVLALQALLESQPVWEGTVTELHQTLASHLTFKSFKVQQRYHWPMNPRGLSNALRRLAPNLRSAGINVHFYRTNQARLIRIEIISRNSC
ncbi:hypothetical protein [Chroococcidiopsis sp. CCMEE 29]|jgi:energy-coupling factor transporter ATP-binding protein EcfA2|uniref:hypothetical protein n=1 Tax=Chroococcidiopsis sp. CCMEE 29 TaxID=155894 RepID=UPI0020227509|nr:hypothetical protein [Chroococcidiopsis sp. CCMEE 29]